MNAAFWRGKRVLVTGHTGFKGSWLVVWLRRLGADVTGYALPPSTSPSMFEAAGVADGIHSIEGDVRDLDGFARSMKQHAPEIVIHMAAQALVKTAYADPVTTYTTNIIGTLGMLEAVRKVPSVRVVVSITSDKCYANREWVWGYRENDQMGGHDPYSSSKGCAELLIAAYRHSYFSIGRVSEHGVCLASTRAGNVVGGGDWSADRLVPDVMKSIMDRKVVLVRQPGAVRPWQFVLEPLRGYLDLAERLWNVGVEFDGAWNFGPNAEQVQPVKWIVEYLVQHWGEGASWTVDAAEHPYEDQFLRLDCTKAKSQLGWSPALDLPTALDWIVEWYRAFQHGDDVRAVTESQIVRYESIIPG